MERLTSSSSPTHSPSFRQVLATLSASFLLSCQSSPSLSSLPATPSCTIAQQALPESIEGESTVFVPGEIVSIEHPRQGRTLNSSVEELFARTGSVELSSTRRIPFSIQSPDGLYRGVALFHEGQWILDTAITPLEHTLLRLMEEIYTAHGQLGFQSVGISLDDGYVQDLLSAARTISSTKEQIGRIHITHFDHTESEEDITLSPPPACS